LKVILRLYRLILSRLFFNNLVKLRAKKVGKKLNVNGLSIVSPYAILGNNVNFNGIRIAGCGEVTIGDNFHSGRDCLILSQNHNYNGEALPYDSKYIARPVTIEDNVWIGERVIILGGVTIGEGSIIQAGSTVVNNIPPLSIAGGHPAKIFNKRNEEHYNELKSKKKFH